MAAWFSRLQVVLAVLAVLMVQTVVLVAPLQSLAALAHPRWLQVLRKMFLLLVQEMVFLVLLFTIAKAEVPAAMVR
jgi:hypothetical protein